MGTGCETGSGQLDDSMDLNIPSPDMISGELLIDASVDEPTDMEMNVVDMLVTQDNLDPLWSTTGRSFCLATSRTTSTQFWTIYYECSVCLMP